MELIHQKQDSKSKELKLPKQIITETGLYPKDQLQEYDQQLPKIDTVLALTTNAKEKKHSRPYSGYPANESVAIADPILFFSSKAMRPLWKAKEF